MPLANPQDPVCLIRRWTAHSNKSPPRDLAPLCCTAGRIPLSPGARLGGLLCLDGGSLESREEGTLPVRLPLFVYLVKKVRVDRLENQQITIK